MAREPLRTGSEMAEEFGIKPVQLAAYLRHYEGKGAPAAMIKSGANYGRSRANWYSPTSMREWWYALPFNVNASKRATEPAQLAIARSKRKAA